MTDSPSAQHGVPDESWPTSGSDVKAQVMKALGHPCGLFPSECAEIAAVLAPCIVLTEEEASQMAEVLTNANDPHSLDCPSTSSQAYDRNCDCGVKAALALLTPAKDEGEQHAEALAGALRELLVHVPNNYKWRGYAALAAYEQRNV